MKGTEKEKLAVLRPHTRSKRERKKSPKKFFFFSLLANNVSLLGASLVRDRLPPRQLSFFFRVTCRLRQHYFCRGVAARLCSRLLANFTFYYIRFLPLPPPPPKGVHRIRAPFITAVFSVCGGGSRKCKMLSGEICGSVLETREPRRSGRGSRRVHPLPQTQGGERVAALRGFPISP